MSYVNSIAPWQPVPMAPAYALGASDGALSRAWDPLFARYGNRLPVAYLRALGKRESNLNPSEAVAPAYGLLQVVPQVRESYNKRKGTSYTQNDLLDPAVNVKIATDLLNRIIVAYGKHPSPNLQEDWGNPEFVKLLTAGWNSGYSEAAGVGRVASYLESRGIPVTHDSVFAHAAAAGGTHHLSSGAKQAWQRTVSDLYFQQPDRPTMGLFLGLALSGFVAWGLYQLLR